MTTGTYLMAAADSRTYYQVALFESMGQWWQWLVLFLVSVAIVVAVTFLYIRDSREVARGKASLLLLLRLTAFGGLLAFFLDIEKRSEKQLTRDSRLALLVDTSQSMGLAESEVGATSPSVRRIDQIVDSLENGDWLNDLRQKHELIVYRFDRDERPTEVASLRKLGTNNNEPAARELLSQQRAQSVRESRLLVMIAAGFLVLAVLGVIGHLIVGKWTFGGENQAWALLASTIMSIVAVVVLAVANLRNPDVAIAQSLGLEPISDKESTSQDTELQEVKYGVPTEDIAETMDWSRSLRPRGTQTRLGDALRFVLDKERDGPFAGIVLISDGQNNAGEECSTAIATAREAGIQIYTVGLGSEKRPVNARVVDIEMPPRVYPRDDFSVTGYLQSSGLDGRTVTVQLLSVELSDSGVGKPPERLEGEQRIRLGGDGEIVAVEFDVSPQERGRRRYSLQVDSPAEDLLPDDNVKSSELEIIERKSRVLLVAGGPTRDFRFLRNQLFRDRDVILDVWLQTSRLGASQEADEMLSEFPSAKEDMFEYDCVVAFDPDWREINDQQARLLEQWVARQAGGIIVVAGPVNTPNWTGGNRRETQLETIRDLYPVSFHDRASISLVPSSFGTDEPWPLAFTDEGKGATFLWLEDSELLSSQAWDAFDGVYGYYTIRRVKPGATVYARFSDPQAAVDGTSPVYFAGQFYGAGRVFYLASGEMWRLRAVDESYFQRFYTKLIRYVSEGRLLRDSNRGVLLVDKQRCLLGDTVIVRASLTDEQYRPLQMETVDASVLMPDGLRETLALRQVHDSTNDGVYAGRFTTTREGDYRVELEIPGAGPDDFLSRVVRSRVPDLEMEQPERNDALMGKIASQTDGAYYVGMRAALGEGGVIPIANAVAPRDQVTFLPGVPDRDFDRLLMSWLLGIICGALCLEWLVRRLNKLA